MCGTTDSDETYLCVTRRDHSSGKWDTHTYGTWLIYIWDMPRWHRETTHSYGKAHPYGTLLIQMGRDSFIWGMTDSCGTWLIHTGRLIRMSQHTRTAETWSIYMCDMTRPYVYTHTYLFSWLIYMSPHTHTCRQTKTSTDSAYHATLWMTPRIAFRSICMCHVTRGSESRHIVNDT